MKATPRFTPYVIKCLFLFFGLSIEGVFACPIDENESIRLESEGLLVSINFQEKSLLLGQIHTLEVRACDSHDEPFIGRVKADAIMPAHNHGMNYQPRFTMKEAGQFVGTGFVFHMPGVWQLLLTLQSEDKKHQFQYEFTL